MLKVTKLMRRNVITCQMTDDLQRAAQLMWENDIGCLPVVDESGRVAGIVTDRDVCMAAYTSGRTLRDLPVPIAMASPVQTCLADDTLRRAEQKMTEHQIRRMPVVDQDRRPIGMISLNDIARSSAHGGVPASEVAATLAAICAPREATAHK